MRDRAAARLFRLARVRRDLRQVDVSDESGLSRTSIANHELGHIEDATVRALRQHAEALGLTLEITMRGPTGEIVNDEEHALATQWVKRQLEPIGWTTDAEASFSIYGERGRIDLLGWYAQRRIVLIDEQKTDLPDVQDLLGTLDVKERLARQIARERGWDADSVAVLLVITRTNRNLRTVKRFEAMFSRFNLRGADAVRWLRDPHGSARLLIFVPPSAVGRAAWRNGRQRVRRKPSPPRNGSSVTTSDTRRPSPPAPTPNVTTSDVTQRLPP
ncbi:MAG: hypothetical protein ACR2I5_02200 [Candidatus Limnocylindria bacterium]